MLSISYQCASDRLSIGDVGGPCRGGPGVGAQKIRHLCRRLLISEILDGMMVRFTNRAEQWVHCSPGLMAKIVGTEVRSIDCGLTLYSEALITILRVLGVWKVVKMKPDEGRRGNLEFNYFFSEPSYWGKTLIGPNGAETRLTFGAETLPTFESLPLPSSSCAENWLSWTQRQNSFLYLMHSGTTTLELKASYRRQ